MKRIYMALPCIALLMASACTDNDYMVLDKGDTELALSSTASEVVLTESTHADAALQLDWTSGTNYGTGNRINYTLELAQSGTDFAAPYIVMSGVQREYSWQPSMEQLNNIVRNNLGARVGEVFNVEARITAVVTGLDGEQVATTAFAVTPYEPVSENLYLIGSAAPTGWSADSPTVMERVDNGIFTVTCVMREGEYKFITDLGQFLPSYNNDGNGGLVYRTSDDQPDEKFFITEAGGYKITANLLDLTVTCTPADMTKPPYEKIWFVGNETGWSFVEMTVDPLDPFLFRIGVFFTKGEDFKFGTADGSWENMYKATEANAPYTSQGVEFIKGYDPDNKWYLKADEINRAYKICLDIRPGAERMMMSEFTPYTAMYMVGSATSIGWDLANALPMNWNEANPNIFTWSGHLDKGELKFSADKKSDWGGAWFMADKVGKAPTGEVEKVVFIDKSSQSCIDQYKDIAVGDVDMKWEIQEDGNYTITLDQLLQEITIVKN